MILISICMKDWTMRWQNRSSLSLPLLPLRSRAEWIRFRVSRDGLYVMPSRDNLLEERYRVILSRESNCKWLFLSNEIGYKDMCEPRNQPTEDCGFCYWIHE